MAGVEAMPPAAWKRHCSVGLPCGPIPGMEPVRAGLPRNIGQSAVVAALAGVASWASTARWGPPAKGPITSTAATIMIRVTTLSITCSFAMLTTVDAMRATCPQPCGCSCSRSRRLRHKEQPEVVDDEFPVIAEQDGCADHPAGSSELTFPLLDLPDHCSLLECRVRAGTEVAAAHGGEAQSMRIIEEDLPDLLECGVPGEDHLRAAAGHSTWQEFARDLQTFPADDGVQCRTGCVR